VKWNERNIRPWLNFTIPTENSVAFLYTLICLCLHSMVFSWLY